MLEIWKFPVTRKSHNVIKMPLIHTILSVQVQGTDDNEVLCIWAMCDTRSPLTDTHFTTYLTGEPLFENLIGAYIGTFLLSNGSFVGHLFKDGE